MKKSRLAVERQKEIYNTISQVGTVYVANLSKKFNVTKETIRKDLEAQEKEGLVQRTHGGAVLNHKMPVQRHMTNVSCTILPVRADGTPLCFLEVQGPAAQLCEAVEASRGPGRGESAEPFGGTAAGAICSSVKADVAAEQDLVSLYTLNK